jgi:hypothetical protein
MFLSKRSSQGLGLVVFAAFFRLGAFAVEFGDCFTQSGFCVNTTAHKLSGGVVSGFCPNDPAAIRCLPEPYGIVDGGECEDAGGLCKKTCFFDGEVNDDITCPGDSAGIKCCIPPATKCTFEKEYEKEWPN